MYASLEEIKNSPLLKEAIKNEKTAGLFYYFPSHPQCVADGLHPSNSGINVLKTIIKCNQVIKK